MGGEKNSYYELGQTKPGSPPRGRGKGEQTARPHYHMRITPAWAGKSFCALLSRSLHEDHPRVGGEKPHPEGKGVKTMGSPPRGRGKVTLKSVLTSLPGITPAWAGKSRTESFGTTSSEDHPRVGGEKLKLFCFEVLAYGSPPRGRGKVAVPARRSVSRGITPAWAGKRLIL